MIKMPSRFTFKKSKEVVAPIAFDVYLKEGNVFIGSMIRTREGYDYQIAGQRIWHETYGISRPTAAGVLSQAFTALQASRAEIQS